MDNAWIVHEIKYQKFKRDSKNLGNNLKKNIKIHSYEKDCPSPDGSGILLRRGSA